MTIGLYDLAIPGYLQILSATAGFLDKGLAHFTANGIDPEEVVASRLYPDMLPFRFQIHSVVHHSVGTVEAWKSGVFRPPSGLPEDDYRALQARVAEAKRSLEAETAQAIDALADREVVFEFKGNRLPFTATGFLTSFSLPNFHFHAATAYDILRMRGVPLGKRDFLGRLRMKA